MADVQITKKQIIVVDSIGENQYKDMTFKDKEGKDYKINAKRVGFFKDKIIQGQAVQLNYAMSSFGKEYIYSADLVKDNLPSPQAPVSPRLETPKEPAPQAVGMTTKEIGDMIRANKLFDIFGKDISDSLTEWYKTQIMGTTRVGLPETPRIEDANATNNPEVVYAEMKALIKRGMWTDAKALDTLKAMGATGKTGMELVKSLSLYKLLQLSAMVKQADKSHLAEAAKQMGAEVL